NADHRRTRDFGGGNWWRHGYRAGIIQANATRKSGQLQISAIAEQTAALEQQNEYLKRADQRRLARENLIAARMLDASMAVVADDIGTARSRFSGSGADGHIDAPTADFVRHSVGKPGFAYIYERLGILDREIAVPFLNLEAAIDRTRAETGETRAG